MVASTPTLGGAWWALGDMLLAPRLVGTQAQCYLELTPTTAAYWIVLILSTFLAWPR